MGCLHRLSNGIFVHSHVAYYCKDCCLNIIVFQNVGIMRGLQTIFAFCAFESLHAGVIRVPETNSWQTRAYCASKYHGGQMEGWGCMRLETGLSNIPQQCCSILAWGPGANISLTLDTYSFEKRRGLPMVFNT